MTCPKCGLQAPADQKFCRSCGAGLQMTTQPLADLAPISKTSTINSRSDQSKNSFVLWGFLLMLIGVAIGVVGKKLVHEDIITVAGVLISLLGMFVTVYRYIKPASGQRNVFPPSSEPEVLTSSSAERLPPATNIDYVPSITERTTGLLKNSAAARPAEKENGNLQPDKSERGKYP